MARNPMFNNGRTDAQNNGLSHDNKATNPFKKYKQGKNNFDLSYKHCNTERYAEITPFLSLDVNPDDTIPFKSSHRLSSYTLKSPMMDEIYKHKFYSLVPYRAIIPNLWELFYTNPTKGDDVPDDVYCNCNLIKLWNDYYTESFKPEKINALNICRFLVATESIFSCGSLLSVLKYNLWSYLYVSKSQNYDVIFDAHSHLFDYVVLAREVQPAAIEYVTCGTDNLPTSHNYRVVSRRTIIDIMRTGDYDFEASFVVPDTSNWETDFNSFRAAFIELFMRSQMILSARYNIDLSRVIAYQITCVSQCSDSSIDYIFNANLFRNVMFPVNQPIVFRINSQPVVYDTFSNVMLTNIWFNTDNFVDTCCKLFSFAKSLKFGDYFTQARPEVLANGDISIDAADGLDALEIARKTVFTRYLNWSNRVGPKYEDYIKELTGMDALPDPTEPSLITHSKGVVSGFQVENTGDAQMTQQNSVTTLLRDSNGGFEFDIIISEPSILLGLTSYDMERFYTRGIDKALLKDNRFDFFNHMLQYTGDQSIDACELDAKNSNDLPVAYTTKDMQYKQQVSRASGGFVFALPSWANTTEDSDNELTLPLGINPEFIRNMNTDFDKFYSHLTGYSLGTYFHFILKYSNDLSGMVRAMDVAPDIL